MSKFSFIHKIPDQYLQKFIFIASNLEICKLFPQSLSFFQNLHIFVNQTWRLRNSMYVTFFLYNFSCDFKKNNTTYKISTDSVANRFRNSPKRKDSKWGLDILKIITKLKYILLHFSIYPNLLWIIRVIYKKKARLKKAIIFRE